ncbi:aspartate aminotransferase [Luminiphilus syltensis NOR5-1B]|uniref:Aspartate aminotransferase n=1 Tax=Luminiphilus syltensis NOR5-1B TaxID=565045 RepID=B8KRU6_9GAMM|nr:amino acid aminotransferase [Luminiphilus syltensis]EED35520.1 aspartate aminotransferase [Luminiphilus syltensis NOR5-1B]
MFEELPVLPPDSILGLAAECRADPNPEKVDLTIGIYMDESGNCPVFKAVSNAQRQLIEQETTKAYLPPQGYQPFLDGMMSLVVGSEQLSARSGQVSAVQTPGGCGAIRIGAEVLQSAAPGARVWVSDPTWPVHLPLLNSVGLHIETYAYYDPATKGVNFDAMVEGLKAAVAGDIVLLHGCCHNPSGADLTPQQWQVIADMAAKQGFTPMIDIAYQGLGDGLEADAVGVRTLIASVPEVVIAASCSKNLGLYRERTGVALFVSGDARSAEATASQAKSAARRVYSMPPAHGGIIAGMVLNDAALRSEWEAELSSMCQRIQGLRTTFREQLEAATGRDFAFIAKEKGMFSFLGLTREQAQQVRKEHSLYMLDSSRINVASLNAGNIERVVAAVAAVS